MRRSKFYDIPNLDNELDLIVSVLTELTGKRVSDFPPANQTRDMSRFIKKVSDTKYEEYIKIDGGFKLLGGGGSAYIELRVSGGFIQWRDDPDGTWTNLIATADLKGDQGDPGATGPQGDPGQGVPAGGTTSQVLKKIDNTDYNTEWADESGGIDINSQTEKPTLADDDVFLIEDSEDGFTKKKVKSSNLPSGGGSSLGLWLPDAPPSLPSAYDDEFDDSSFDTGLWTEFDPAVALSITENEKGLILTQAPTTNLKISGIYQSIPAGDFCITSKCLQTEINLVNYRGSGIALWEDATDTSKKLVALYRQNSSSGFRFYVMDFTNYQTWSTNIFTGSIIPVVYMYFRIRRVSTTYYFDTSFDGYQWYHLYSGSLSFTPLHFGLFVDNQRASGDLIVGSSFFRYKADGSGTQYLEGRRI